MKRLLLLPVLLVLLLCNVKAQPYYFRHYQVEAGLSNNTVYCSVQDRAGFLWFGTKEGLNRFDGYHFKTFRLRAAGALNTTSDHIYTLFNDEQGTLWVGAQKGLYRFDAEAEHLVRVADSLTDVSAIQTDGNGNLWFISAGSLCCYNQEKTQVKRFDAGRYFQATSLARTADGCLWAGTPHGDLKKFVAATATFESYHVFSHSPHAASRHIQKIFAAGADSILVGTTSQGLKLFQTSMRRYTDVLMHNEDKTAVFVRDIMQRAPGEYWLATESGLFIWHTGTGRFTNLKKRTLDPQSLSDNAVYALCRDREGGIWAGTYFGGVNYLPRQAIPFRKYFPDYSGNSISGNVVREICEDRYGNLWIATEDAGLNRLSPSGVVSRFEPAAAPGSIAYSNVHGLLANGDDLWVGTFEHGLDILDIRSGAVKKHYMAGPGPLELKSNFIITLLKTTAGAIFIGTSNGLFQYDKAADGFTPAPWLPAGGFTATLLQGRDGTIWTGVNGRGLFFFNPATGVHGHLKNLGGQAGSLPLDAINALYEDGKGNLWVATEGRGLFRISQNRKTGTRYTTVNGLPGDFVFKVLEDNNGMIWASTSKGLVRLDAATSATTVYTKAAGLLNDQFNYNSGFKTADGTLYFGSVKGMISFKPEAIGPSLPEAPLYITGFQVHQKELPVGAGHGGLKKSIVFTDAITLPHHQSSFSIDVAALSFAAPEMTMYSYRMHGLESDRTYLKSNRKIYFTNLAPGTYRFSVATAGPGRAGGKEKTLRITILPPWWASPWAYAVYALAGLALFYYLMRSYHLHLDDKKEKELYEAKLDFFTNITHELRTPLTLIKGPLENVAEQTTGLPDVQADVKAMERATNRLLSLITQILDFRKAETKHFSLRFSKVNITKLVQEEAAAFMPLAGKRRLQVALDLPPADVHAFADEEAVQKILDNLFSNAVKYAASKIEVRFALKRSNAELILKIANDGNLIPPDMRERIFEPFYRPEGMRQTGSGIGLALAQSLASLHNGSLYLKDAKNGLNTFVLRLPLQPQPTARSPKNGTPFLKTK